MSVSPSSVLLYLDTNVIMDFLLGRYEPSSRPIDAAVACRHRVLISSHTLKELNRNGVGSEAFLRVLHACGKVSLCLETEEDRVEASRAVATHVADALHKVLAKRHGADILVTRNVRDFPFTDIVVRRPDDI